MGGKVDVTSDITSNAILYYTQMLVECWTRARKGVVVEGCGRLTGVWLVGGAVGEDPCYVSPVVDADVRHVCQKLRNME